MNVTAILFGMNVRKTQASGLVTGAIGDIPTRRVTYQTDLPAGSALVDHAEDAYAISNDPGRFDEWNRLAGQTRSLSTGDVVLVGKEHAFLCLGMGWKDISANREAVIAELDEAGTWEGRRRISERPS